jgi:hypothetical protein
MGSTKPSHHVEVATRREGTLEYINMYTTLRRDDAYFMFNKAPGSIYIKKVHTHESDVFLKLLMDFRLKTSGLRQHVLPEFLDLTTLNEL